MAGINRLGKAPPRPGTLRAPDPNKFRTVDVFSEGTEGDPDYARMVQDIEDAQAKQGWLFSRGAFDKGDLLYLRDEEEKRRHVEADMRDSERAQFMAQRARVDSQQQAAPLAVGTAGPAAAPLAPPGGGGPGPPRAAPVRAAARGLPPVIKVAARPAAAAAAGGPPAKRLRGDNSDGGAAGLAGLIGDYGSGSSDSEDEPDSDRQPAAASPTASNRRAPTAQQAGASNHVTSSPSKSAGSPARPNGKLSPTRKQDRRLSSSPHQVGSAVEDGPELDFEDDAS